MLEARVEKALKEGVEARGGLCEKFAQSGRRGIPDRIVSWPKGVVHFIELKRPGEVPDPHQLRDHARRRALEQKVFVIDSVELVNSYLYLYG